MNSMPVARTKLTRHLVCGRAGRGRGKGVLGGPAAISLKHSGQEVGRPPAGIAVTNSNGGGIPCSICTHSTYISLL